MKLEEIRKDYERYSTNVSSLNRQLIFAGLAIIWLFRIPEKGTASIPTELVDSLFFFVFSLCSDIFQYVTQSLIWAGYYWYNKCKHRSNKKNVEKCVVNEPEWPNLLPWLLWALKIIFLGIAYWKLACYLHLMS